MSAINFLTTCESYTLTVHDEQVVCATPTPVTPTATTPTPSATPPTTPTVAPTSTPIPSSPTPAPCTSTFTATGSLATSDPWERGLLAKGDPTVCGVPISSCAAFSVDGTYYDAYRFTNNTGAARCVSVNLTSGCTSFRAVASAAYSPMFTGMICPNIIAESGGEANPSVTYSFTVPAGQPYDVVVSGTSPSQTCGSYTLTVRDEQAVCGTPTPVSATATAVLASSTPVPTTTATLVPATASVTTIATPTQCSLSFTDVPTTSTFYAHIRCLACKGILGGYSDGTFRPNNDITRGQIAKVVSNAAGFNENPGAQIYEDVPPNQSFYEWINRLSMRGHMGGYPCGTMPAEPCGTGDRPYFRPSASATRGQLAKIVASARQITGTPTGQRYADVPEDSTFYVWIEQLSSLGVMGGYACGSVPTEPCDDQSRAYFRPFNNVTRGQASKIVANTFFPGCPIE
ncbi:MAG TPA: S-layer homology domain-containing protein [Chloroflexia bacterium]|nr:S-layer homology domain-containing protein [Chloroflexia bacterium]